MKLYKSKSSYTKKTHIRSQGPHRWYWSRHTARPGNSTCVFLISRAQSKPYRSTSDKEICIIIIFRVHGHSRSLEGQFKVIINCPLPQLKLLKTWLSTTDLNSLNSVDVNSFRHKVIQGHRSFEPECKTKDLVKLVMFTLQSRSSKVTQR